MKLQRANFPVAAIRLGTESAWRGGVLDVDAAQLVRLVAQDPAIADVRLEVARPGASQRIIHILDTLQPFCKVEGTGTAFPGFQATSETVGRGRTNVLTGMAVMTAAELPWATGGGLRSPRESIVDMSGPAAPLSPFSSTWNLIVRFGLTPGRDHEEYNEAVSRAGVKAARFLVECTRNLEAPEVVEYELGPCAEDLPRVVYVHQVQSQGTFGHSYLYGRPLDTLVPTLVHPNELFDGALVNGNYLYPCFEIPTYLKCNLPLVQELYAGHGREHNFLGVILSRGHYYSFDDKLRVAQHAAKVAAMLHADGAVLAWEGGGNSLVEAMLTVQALEQSEIPTVVVAYELGGAEGRDAPLIQSVPEARALVSAGSYEKTVSLPAVDEVVGGDELRLHPELGERRVSAVGPLDVYPAHELYCAANQSGIGRLQAVEF